MNFLSRLGNWIISHKIITALIVIGLGVAGFYGYRAYGPKDTSMTYTLSAATRGPLISTLSGTGQVSALDQLNVQSQASGNALMDSPAIGTAVKAGDVLMRLDSTSAQKAVRDAQTAYQSAKLSYNKLTTPADQLSITQATDAVSQAQRAEAQAEANLAQLQSTSAQTAQTAYDDGYNSVSSAFLDMPNHMKDLRDLRGTDVSTEANVSSFQNILGVNSPLITIWLHDHDAAIAAYNDTFTFFKTVPRTSDNATLADLISRTLKTELAVSQALQSSNSMLDAVVNTTYSPFAISSTVNTMRPKMTSDIAQINNDISATQNANDTLVANQRDTPINLKKDQDAIDAAKENVIQATQSLAKLQAGPDPLDVQASQISVTQKLNALTDAQQNLANYVTRAPFDGTIAASSIQKGDNVGTNSTVVTLVTQKRLATITLNEVDAVKVVVGQKVTLTFDAIDGLSIAGEVSSVDVIGTVSQGVVNYNVRIQFDSQDTRVKPGMSVNAAVITNIKPDVLLVPNAAVKTQGSASYVQVFSDPALSSQRSVTTKTLPTQVTVQVGDSNDTSTEITSGLTEGQTVVIKTASPIKTTTAAPAAASAVRIPGLTGGGGFGGGGFNRGPGG
jgi:RND family efflux transporter MFP subunit